MVIINTPQGSLDWFIQRLYRLTASEMSRNISPKTATLSKSEAATQAIDKLIAGITLANVMIARQKEFANMDDRELGNFMSAYTGEKFFSNRHTERGADREHVVIAKLRELTGLEFRDVGLCVMGDSVKGVISCSPDALIYKDGELVSGAEVKNPSLCHYLRHIREGVLPDEYKLQVHASMVICSVDHWNFASYCAEAEASPIFHVVAKWDSYTDQLKKSLIEFQGIYMSQYEQTMDAMIKNDKTTRKI